MKCLDCEVTIPEKRRLAITERNLNQRCIPCQEQNEKRVRPENVRGLAVGADFDSLGEHLADRQGML